MFLTFIFFFFTFWSNMEFDMFRYGKLIGINTFYKSKIKNLLTLLVADELN